MECSTKKSLRPLGQQVCPVAHAWTDRQTDRQSEYWVHPFKVSGIFLQHVINGQSKNSIYFLKRELRKCYPIQSFLSFIFSIFLFPSLNIFSTWFAIPYISCFLVEYILLVYTIYPWCFVSSTGEAESNIKKIFTSALNRSSPTSPSIIVIDDLDVICPRRIKGQAGQGQQDRIVATLLGLVDDCAAQVWVINGFCYAILMITTLIL